MAIFRVSSFLSHASLSAPPLYLELLVGKLLPLYWTLSGSRWWQSLPAGSRLSLQEFWGPFRSPVGPHTFGVWWMDAYRLVPYLPCPPSHTIPYSYMIVRTTKQGGPAQHFVSGRPPGKASIIQRACREPISRLCPWRMRPHLPASLPHFTSLRGDEESCLQHATACAI